MLRPWPNPRPKRLIARMDPVSELATVPTAHPAELCWLTAVGLVSTPAVLMDIDHARVLLLSDRAPAVGTPVVVRLSELAPRTWVAGRVTRDTPLRVGPHELDLTLPAPPPRWLVAATAVGSSDRN